MHWILDVGFNEDANRTRKGHAAENLAVMRPLALNALKQDKATKLSINNKRFKACNDLDYLNKLVTSLDVFKPSEIFLTPENRYLYNFIHREVA